MPAAAIEAKHRAGVEVIDPEDVGVEVLARNDVAV